MDVAYRGLRRTLQLKAHGLSLQAWDKESHGLADIPQDSGKAAGIRLGKVIGSY
jgi:hypothetical protein